MVANQQRVCDTRCDKSGELVKWTNRYALQIIRRLSILLLLLANNARLIYSMATTPLSASSKEDLDEAEANGKLEIVKQIKKVNDDGSYTIGYEADDGTFKIESRDVLGNIKGTYGYIDENGDIKRVSYSTNNGSNSEIILPKTDADQTINLSGASSSVVQRIPKINKTQSTSTTRRPSNVLYHSTATNTPATPASSSTNSVVIQSIPKRRMTTTTTSSPSTTTADPGKISDFIKAAVEASKSPSNRGHIYETASPRILLQQRSSIRAEDVNQRSEGQILRPDVVARPTESPIYRARKSEDIEESKSNLLRRQLQPEAINFDLKRRPLSLHQSQGDGDMADVYGSTITASTTRPLFTTLRPKFVSSSTIAPTIQRPTIRYPSSKGNQGYEEEASTENIPSTTVNSVPVVVQSLPNAEQNRAQGPLVAIKHPLSGRTVLVPLNQLQQVNRYENVQYNEEVPAVQPVYTAQPPRFRPIQVRIDENGYVRQMPQYQQVPYPIPIRVTPATQDYLGEEDEINLIKPPVSTRDFQKLLDQLILRQSRLEQISALTRRYQQHTFGQRNRPIYNPNLLVYRRPASDDMNMPLNLEQQNLYNYQSFTPTPESYTPTRRVTRLLNARNLQKDDREDDEDYLPPDVREMLLLRMLQLAINPSLPLNIPDNFEEGLNAMTRRRKVGGARNVEILGEEDDTQKLTRSKR